MMPTAPDLPSFTLDRTITPSPMNPLGVKGVGEAATIGSTPAIVNAVLDALTPLGIVEMDPPCSPARVWEAIRRARPGGPVPAGGPSVGPGAARPSGS